VKDRDAPELRQNFARHAPCRRSHICKTGKGLRERLRAKKNPLKKLRH